MTGLADSNPEKRSQAVDKAVALATDVFGPMGKPCPVCRGGWWFEDDALAAAVHATDCPRADDET
jgi:hypothetical protein